MNEASPVTPEKPVRPPSLLRRAIDNPVISKELRGLMRGRRAFLLLTGYVAVISLFTLITYTTLQLDSYSLRNLEYRQGVGKAIFGTIVLLELTLISFIAPALTSGAITAERERQTFDLLRTTLLSARSLIFGKLGAALIYLFILIFAALPIQSLAFLLGGVGLAELIISSLLLVVTALFFSTLGLFFSSFLRRTLASTVSSYGALVGSYLALGMAVFPLFILIDLSGTNTSPFQETVMVFVLWMLVSSNPMLTAILSEVILIEDQSLFYTTSMTSSNLPFLPSPWIPFTVIYLMATVLLILISAYFVSRRDRT